MHTLTAELLRREVRVLVVGCGGNGTAVAAGLPYLHQAMLVAGHPGGLRVTLMDGDIISPANCVRQPFSSAEIGLAKAVVMVSRLNLFWGLSWTAIPEFLSEQSKIGDFDVVIGCVDTRAARIMIGKHVQGWRSRVGYWLDLGNSADSGQFVLGQPLNGRNRRSMDRLRTAPEVFPELSDESLDATDGPSCSAARGARAAGTFCQSDASATRTRLAYRLFRYGRIDHHGAFVNIAQNRVQPLAISPEAWKKMRRRGRQFLRKATA